MVNQVILNFFIGKNFIILYENVEVNKFCTLRIFILIDLNSLTAQPLKNYSFLKKFELQNYLIIE